MYCALVRKAGRLLCAGGDVAALGRAREALSAFLKEIIAYLPAEGREGVAAFVGRRRPDLDRPERL